MPEIETDRLLLSSYTGAHAPAMAALHAEPRVMDFMKDSRPLPAEEAAATLARYVAGWDRDGFGIFAVQRRDTGDFVGECGCWRRGDKPGVSMRYLLMPAHWGRGFGTEMTAAVTQWLFTETHVTSFWAVTQARNKASVAILRRLGAVVTETAHEGRNGLLRFDVTRDAWATTRAHSPKEEDDDDTDTP